MQHVLEADPKLVEQERLKILNAKRSEDQEVGLDHCPSELDESMDQIEFQDYRSSASCKLSEIKNIIYGGQSSRFWMLRKHINSVSRKKIETIPFKSWNCITL